MEFYEDLARAMQNLSTTGAFLTVRDNSGRVNTMTISWGYVGFSWNKPHFLTLVRPQRFTHELIENADSFTISIPYDGKLKDALAVCGTKSGRDTDKAALAGIRFVDAQKVDSPVVDGCDMYYECKITYTDALEVEKLALGASAHYNGDRHDLYFGEIVHIAAGR